MIGFIGSVFSPWYAWSGRRNPADHCCINVALYGRGGRWTMTDRGAAALKASRDTLEVGPSRMHWDGSALTVEIDEVAVPHCDRVRGSVRVHPAAVGGMPVALHPDGSHVWRPYAPVAEIEVAFDRPGWRWRGSGYFDANFGTRALEADFRRWTWSRRPLGRGAACFYDAERRDGTALSTALSFDGSGGVETIEPAPPRVRLARSRWGLRRETRGDEGSGAAQVKPMLDAPFYCRSAVRTTVAGETAVGVHEALDLDRFASRWLKPMLAVKVPRRSRWP